MNSRQRRSFGRRLSGLNFLGGKIVPKRTADNEELIWSISVSTEMIDSFNEMQQAKSSRYASVSSEGELDKLLCEGFISIEAAGVIKEMLVQPTRGGEE